MFRRSLIIIFFLAALPVAAATWMLAPVFTGVTPAETSQPAQSSQPADAAKIPDLAALQPRMPTADPARFDIARIDPKGWSVFAGTAPANASVTITADGVTVGTTKADHNGEWTLSADHRFASAAPKLAVATTTGNPTDIAAAAASMTSTPKAASESGSKLSQAASSSPQQISAAEATKGMMRKLEDLVAAARVEEAATAPAQVTPKVEQSPMAVAPVPAPAASQSDRPATSKPPPTAKPPSSPVEAAAPVATPATEKQVVATATPSAATPAPVAAPSVVEPRQPAKAAAAPVPVPMQFVFREATFTEDGRKAADLLVEYLRLKKPAAISMDGHADERGSDALNLELSRHRLETVAAYLREKGYAGEFSLTPKGRSEPYTGVDRSRYSRDALHQLDRRVEVLLDIRQPARAAGTASSASPSPTRN